MSSRSVSSDCFYIFTSSDSTSSVIVAADDCAYPVLGFTDRPLPSLDSVPDNIRAWLDGYRRQIQYARDNNLMPSPQVRARWRSVEQMAEPKTVVAPLLKTQWDQDAPYNKLVPASMPTGCVATAMAQIMRFWSYPKRGTGSRSYSANGYSLSADFEHVTYNWSLMPARLTGSSPDYQKTAVATVMYHCGVASMMTYSPSGSGTYLIEIGSQRGDDCAEYAFKNHFGYSSRMKGRFRDYKTQRSGYSDEEWTNLVKEDLDAGRPVLYSGYGDSYDSGHAFVCDGYRDDDTFHFNWGWSGWFDGWFALNALVLNEVGTGGGDGNFNYYQHALFNLEPDSGQEEIITKDIYDLQMYSDLSISNPSISSLTRQPLGIMAHVRNYGEKPFAGSLFAVISDSIGNPLDTIWKNNVELSSAQDKSYSVSGYPSLMLLPAAYSVMLYSLDSEGVQMPVGDKYFSNQDFFEVALPESELTVLSPFILSDSLMSGEAAHISVSAGFISRTLSSCRVRLALLSLSLNEVKQVLLSQTLSGDSSSAAVDLTFSGVLSVPAGSYILALQYSDGVLWRMAGSAGYFNPVLVVVNGVTSSVDALSSSLRVYPSAVRDFLYVEMPSSSVFGITLTDMFGGVVLSRSFSTAASGLVSLDVSSLPAGVYFLSVYSPLSPLPASYKILKL